MKNVTLAHWWQWVFPPNYILLPALFLIPLSWTQLECAKVLVISYLYKHVGVIRCLCTMDHIYDAQYLRPNHTASVDSEYNFSLGNKKSLRNTGKKKRRRLIRNIGMKDLQDVKQGCRGIMQSGNRSKGFTLITRCFWQTKDKVYQEGERKQCRSVLELNLEPFGAENNVSGNH